MGTGACMLLTTWLDCVCAFDGAWAVGTRAQAFEGGTREGSAPRQQGVLGGGTGTD